jgi:hypothetical protein
MELDSFKCIDSIPQFTNDKRIKIPMIYEFGTEDKIDKLCSNGNIRKDTHIIIFNNWLVDVMSDEEKTRLDEFRTNLLVAIEANSRLWHLSTSQTEKEERNKMNIYNRNKLKVVENLLK